jgi:hypothetical protein
MGKHRIGRYDLRIFETNGCLFEILGFMYFSMNIDCQEEIFIHKGNLQTPVLPCTTFSFYDLRPHAVSTTKGYLGIAW